MLLNDGYKLNIFSHNKLIILIKINSNLFCAIISNCSVTRLCFDFLQADHVPVSAVVCFVPSPPPFGAVWQSALLLQPHHGEAEVIQAHCDRVSSRRAVLQGRWSLRESQRPVGSRLHGQERLQPGAQTPFQRKCLHHELRLLWRAVL